MIDKTSHELAIERAAAVAVKYLCVSCANTTAYDVAKEMLEAAQELKDARIRDLEDERDRAKEFVEWANANVHLEHHGRPTYEVQDRARKALGND